MSESSNRKCMGERRINNVELLLLDIIVYDDVVIFISSYFSLYRILADVTPQCKYNTPIYKSKFH